MTECECELGVLIAPDLLPQGDGWLSTMIEPLLTDTEVVAVRGAVTPREDLPPYVAYRFERERVEPLDAVAFRRSAWEKHAVQKSGNLGLRWLERLGAEGKVVHAADAVATGGMELPDSFLALVDDGFSNLPLSVVESVRAAVTETLTDWDGLRKKQLSRPGPTYARAAMTRLAENLGKSRIKGLLTRLKR